MRLQDACSPLFPKSFMGGMLNLKTAFKSEEVQDKGCSIPPSRNCILDPWRQQLQQQDYTNSFVVGVFVSSVSATQQPPCMVQFVLLGLTGRLEYRLCLVAYWEAEACVSVRKRDSLLSSGWLGNGEHFCSGACREMKLWVLNG